MGKSQGQRAQDCKSKVNHCLQVPPHPGLDLKPLESICMREQPFLVAIHLTLCPDILLSSCPGRPSYCGH